MFGDLFKPEEKEIFETQTNLTPEEQTAAMFEYTEVAPTVTQSVDTAQKSLTPKSLELTDTTGTFKDSHQENQAKRGEQKIVEKPSIYVEGKAPNQWLGVDQYATDEEFEAAEKGFDRGRASTYEAVDASETDWWYKPAKHLAQGLRDFGLTLLTTNDPGKAAAAGIGKMFGDLDNEVAEKRAIAERTKSAQQLVNSGKATGAQAQAFIDTGDYGVFSGMGQSLSVSDRIAIERLEMDKAKAQKESLKGQQVIADKVNAYDRRLTQLNEMKEGLISGKYDTGPIQGSDLGIKAGEILGTEDAANLKLMETTVYTMVDEILNAREGTQTDRDALSAMKQTLSTSNTKEANLKIVDQMYKTISRIRDYEAAKVKDLSLGTAIQEYEQQRKSGAVQSSYSHLW